MSKDQIICSDIFEPVNARDIDFYMDCRFSRAGVLAKLLVDCNFTERTWVPKQNRY